MNAGYYGEFDPRAVPPAAIPDPCSANVADMKSALMMHVQGFGPATVKPGAFLDGIDKVSARVITVAFGDPYILSRLPETDAILTPYNTTVLAEQSVAKAILGELQPTGRLPVTLQARTVPKKTR